MSLRILVTLFNGLFRRLLNIWVKTDVVGANEAKENGLDPEQPIFYALPHHSYSASLVLDTETRKHHLPHALEPVEIAGTQFKNRIVFLSRTEGSWLRPRATPVSYTHLTLPTIYSV